MAKNMAKKKIKVKFVDFWEGHILENNLICRIFSANGLVSFEIIF